jgi:purine nucleoside phosphorylase
VTSELTLALVGGTGLTELEDHAEALDIDTPYGLPSAPIRVIETDPLRLLFLPRHGSPHRFPPHLVNYRANMWALKEAGAGQVLAVSAVGGITEAYGPGSLAAPDQLIDYSWGREHSYSDSEHVPLAHVDFTNPYEGPLRRALLQSADRIGLELVDGGCIGVFQGGLDYAGIAVISNWGAGVSDDLISEDDIAETLREPMGRVRALLKTLVQTLSNSDQAS